MIWSWTLVQLILLGKQVTEASQLYLISCSRCANLPCFTFSGCSAKVAVNGVDALFIGQGVFALWGVASLLAMSVGCSPDHCSSKVVSDETRREIASVLCEGSLELLIRKSVKWEVQRD